MAAAPGPARGPAAGLAHGVALGAASVAAQGLALLLLAAPPAVRAGALDECSRRVASQREVAPCLEAARRAATDAMLESYIAVGREMAALERVTGRSGPIAALRDNQRDFERYLRSHCELVRQSYGSGNGAGQAQLACEVDQLLARERLLSELAPERPAAPADKAAPQPPAKP
jgi:uncharacterized protein YecT (DUF1311 family)